ncbi:MULTISPECIES: hypothetical protein [Streptomyces]|uniref:hypothetical protein n=1 Tax=Streptomyces TaxID=1883 RepID=UPI001317AA94|nr:MULTISPECIES: hypothetical protein [Streptomyces]QGZ50230.1 hypothetical protein GPZ77_19365 [Streptomyces sp. QHH-9511]GGU03139.1 hypothetical protein GCM10010272_55340 [Streptomyces lateritius]
MRSETPSGSSDATAPGDGLVRAGAIVFIIGAVATLVTVAPLFLGTDPFPPVAYAVCMLMGVGFLVAGAGVLRSIGAQRRQARAVAQPR